MWSQKVLGLLLIGASYIGPYLYHIPENNNIVGMGYHPQSGLMIVAITRTRPGVPITMGAFCVKFYSVGSSPKIWAFPDNEANLLKSSDYDSITIALSTDAKKKK